MVFVVKTRLPTASYAGHAGTVEGPTLVDVVLEEVVDKVDVVKLLEVVPDAIIDDSVLVKLLAELLEGVLEELVDNVELVRLLAELPEVCLDEPAENVDVVKLLPKLLEVVVLVRTLPVTVLVTVAVPDVDGLPEILDVASNVA